MKNENEKCELSKAAMALGCLPVKLVAPLYVAENLLKVNYSEHACGLLVFLQK